MPVVGVHVGVGRRRRAAGGASGPALVPAGATYVMTGDGTMSASSAAGIRNIPFWLMSFLDGRLQPAPLPLIAASGTTIARDDGSNTAFIIPIAIPAASAQYADVFFFLGCGANDNVLSSNPANTPWLQDWKDAVTLTVASNPQAKRIVICEPGPSTKAGEATYAADVRAQMAAHSASFNDPRIVHVATGSIVANNWSLASDVSRVHPDERGGPDYAGLVYAAILPHLEVKARADILDAIFAGTYPGMAAQLDVDRALVGTGGTVTNLAGGSVAPTSKLITNLTGSTAISSAVVATMGGRQKAVVTLGGTVTADNKVMLQDKSNLVFTAATPGQFLRHGMVVRAGAGFVNAGIDLGSYGVTGGGANSQAATSTTAPVANAIDSLWIGFSLPLFGSPLQGKRSVAFRYPAGAAPAGSIEVEQPFAWVVNDRLRGAPVYLGALAIVTANYKLRVSGSVAAGFRFEPGYWNLAGLTEADFAQRRIYKGGSTAIGSGTLVATLSGSTWTVSAAASGVIAGDQLWAEVDVNNGIGGTATARSATALAAV